MKIYTSKLYQILHSITGVLSKINWMPLYAKFNNGRGYNLTEADHALLKEKLAGSYYIILTNRKTHLTTYLIGLLSFLKTGKWPEYSHALMNADSIVVADNWEEFKFMEATNAGVHYSKFMEVFDCDSVCLLKPKSLDSEEWNKVIDGLLEQNGKKYDDLFNLADDSHVSCVELVLAALRKNPNYEIDFATLEYQINNVGNLTPQMYKDCTDFEVVLEIKR